MHVPNALTWTGWLRRRLGPERRLHPRYSHRPLLLKIEGRRYRTIDWSLGGFRLGPFHREATIGMRIEGDVVKSGRVQPGRFVAQVVRFTEDGGLGLRWLDIAPATFIGMSSVRA
jgi:hypothetical protein